MRGTMLIFSLLSGCLLPGCATTYMQMEGQCVMQQWRFATVVMRNRLLCELPVPRDHDELRERDPMETNPFPDYWEPNKADSMDPNMLEKSMGLPQKEEDE